MTKTVLDLQGDWGDALIKDGVFYAQFIGEVDACTAATPPGIFADIHAVADWIKTTTGAKYDTELQVMLLKGLNKSYKENNSVFFFFAITTKETNLVFICWMSK